MYFLKITTALLLATCVFARPYFKDCADSDVECRKERMKKFFTELSGGNADLGVKPMDPMDLDEVDVTEDTLNLLFHYKNLKVTGLKDVVIEEFLQEKDTDIAHITLKFNYVAEGPVDVEFIKKDKVFNGNVKYEAGVTGIISYPFSTKTENGKDISIIGQETLTCESSNVKATINEELRKKLLTDPDGKSIEDQYEKMEKQHQSKVACEIAKAVSKVVVENLRTLLKN